MTNEVTKRTVESVSTSDPEGNVEKGPSPSVSQPQQNDVTPSSEYEEPILSPFCDELRDSLLVELWRHIRNDYSTYLCYVMIIVAFYSGVSLSFYLGLSSPPRLEEDTIKGIFEAVLTELFNARFSIAKRYHNMCVVARNETVSMLRYSMFEYFERQARRLHSIYGLSRLYRNLAKSLRKRIEMTTKHSLYNVSVYSYNSFSEAYTYGWTLNSLKPETGDKVPMKKLIVRAIHSVKVYGVVPFYARLLWTAKDKLCLAFMPEIHSDLPTELNRPNGEFAPWICTNAMVTGYVEFQALHNLLHSSPTKTPPNWSNKVYAYLDNADKVLNGFETDWPQRAMQRALLIKDAIKHNAFQNVPVNKQVMPELLFPEYFRVLVVLSSWTSFNRAPAAKRASEAVRDSFAILVARKNLSDVQNVEYNKIIGYGLNILKRQNAMFNCEEVFTNVIVAFIRISIKFHLTIRAAYDDENKEWFIP